MSEIVKCDYCDSYIEYDETDYKVAFGCNILRRSD